MKAIIRTMHIHAEEKTKKNQRNDVKMVNYH